MKNWVKSFFSKKAPQILKNKSFKELGDVRIICYEDTHAWILGKFALRMQESMVKMGIRSDIEKFGDANKLIGHHIIYYDAVKKWSPIETFMITHLDADWKYEKVRELLDLYDMGICMSEELCNKLRKMGMPASKLCYINPAQDGLIKPRPKVIGISTKVHIDGRKKENEIVAVFKSLPVGAYSLKILGSGWDNQVEELRKKGHLVEYIDHFDYEIYVNEFMASLDYFVYWTHDEGTMTFLDAIAADVKTIVTPQGYHLDIEKGIDFPISNAADLANILNRLHTERIDRISRVQDLTWDEYTWRHVVIWDYLRISASHSLDDEMAGIDIQITDHIKGILDEKRTIPSEEDLRLASAIAEKHHLNVVGEQLVRKMLIFYPKSSYARAKLREIYSFEFGKEEQ